MQLHTLQKKQMLFSFSFALTSGQGVFVGFPLGPLYRLSVSVTYPLLCYISLIFCLNPMVVLCDQLSDIIFSNSLSSQNVNLRVDLLIVLFDA